MISLKKLFGGKRLGTGAVKPIAMSLADSPPQDAAPETGEAVAHAESGGAGTDAGATAEMTGGAETATAVDDTGAATAGATTAGMAGGTEADATAADEQGSHRKREPQPDNHRGAGFLRRHSRSAKRANHPERTGYTGYLRKTTRGARGSNR